MNDELQVLKRIAVSLDKAHLEYMISGSIAANYYTIPRMTRDIDIVIELKKSDANRFIKLFEKEFYVDPETVKEEIQNRGMFNLIHNEHVVKADFILRKDTPYADIAFARKTQVAIDNTPIWMISPEDLILAKLLWARESGSEMQIRDAQNLIHGVTDLDFGYIEKWVNKFGLSTIYRKAKP